MNRDNRGRFIKNHVALNKGKRKDRICAECGVIFHSSFPKKYCSISCWDKNRSISLSRGWHSIKREKWFSGGFIKHQKSMVRFGEYHSNWKGDKVGYIATHSWIVRKKGKASYCSFNPEHKSTRYHWANISGTYMRDVDDYASLCPTCHKTYDLIVTKYPKEIFFGYTLRRWR